VATPHDDAEIERRLADVERLRRRVLNVIPHALRTPITTFRGLAEALPNATDAQIRGDIAPALRRLAAQAEHLLDDMLVAAGYTTALPTGPRQASPVAATAVAVWADVGGGRPIDIDVLEDVSVLAARGALHKMLVHLLDNAVKYTDGDVSLSATAHGAGDKVEVVLVTRGAVIDDLDMLTEAFYRGEVAVTRSSGLGVGLTVAAALAHQAGGDLQLSATPGGGLTTTLVLERA